ncbi:nucleoside hydrolase [Rossellomorea marisflavi]|uniref:Nucleoside hydrolase n=1 Tax=Rossellomorea marisflavi TaxID=189381 RepID=A0A0J5S5M3_9BACI|nr:nucleoside hydrolase [Rossellomorea marisflavi]KMK90376.1 nucleoside hydrolase [Rossellomorea marisflavi]KML34560.1 nucleoside hydrolase [Rossellomorea marisflavi]KZE47252.1 nucleoside hydrolase [Rossellomorea marisflavi]MCM2606326.1 nucleoside hydrolase [Rossellomorea marisflavi]QHA34824.1 nucleoside hydrolase [Rossellomorea marisflavi]
MKRKLILDVDTGIDDAIGIILAVKSREFDLLGITTVNGNVSLDQATDNTLKVLDLLGETNLSVIKGADAPLIRPQFFEHGVHGEDGLGGELKDILPSRPAEEGFAPDFIINSILNFPHEVTLVMTGPLTNLALAIKKCPQIVHYVKEVIFMGGVVKGPGNVTPTAEFNMVVDPEAVKIVLHAGFNDITQVGLDVTRHAILKEDHIQAIENPVIREYIDNSTAQYRKRYFKRNGVDGCAMHDPLAVAVAIDKSLVKTEDFFVDVETRSELCDGQLVCDFQNRLEQDRNLSVCTEVDEAAFLRLFHSIVSS